MAWLTIVFGAEEFKVPIDLIKQDGIASIFATMLADFDVDELRYEINQNNMHLRNTYVKVHCWFRYKAGRYNVPIERFFDENFSTDEQFIDDLGRLIALFDMTQLAEEFAQYLLSKAQEIRTDYLKGLVSINPHLQLRRN